MWLRSVQSLMGGEGERGVWLGGGEGRGEFPFWPGAFTGLRSFKTTMRDATSPTMLLTHIPHKASTCTKYTTHIFPMSHHMSPVNHTHIINESPQIPSKPHTYSQ